MGEEYKLQVTYNLVPAAQYQKGDMLNIRANTADELKSLIDDARGVEALAPFFGAAPVPTEASSSTTDSSAPSDEEAQAAIARHLGPGTEEPATAGQVTVLKSKGVPEDEARGLSRTAAAARIQELKSGG